MAHVMQLSLRYACFILADLKELINGAGFARFFVATILQFSARDRSRTVVKTRFNQ